MNQNTVNIDLVLENMSIQIATLSKEKAIRQAYSTQQAQEIEQLRAEIEQLKKELSEKEKATKAE
jgi:uncharacterized protein (DUF3084 family)